MSDVVFRNSARRLYLTDNAATPTLTHIPTLSVEDNPQDTEESWHSSADVSGGIAYQNGQVTALGMAYNVSTKLFTTADATPALNTALSDIKTAGAAVGSSRRLEFVLKEADGTGIQFTGEVRQLKTAMGATNESAGMTFQIFRCGAPSTYSGSYPD